MRIWGLTDIGLVRKENQDAYAVRELPFATICVVCDGMGGTCGGQMASNIAVSTYVTELEKVLRPGMTPQELGEASAHAVALANEAIRRQAEQSEEFKNMGTTLVSAVTYPGGAAITNVGDSRAYHVTAEGITRVTKDHSLVEDMVDRGDITAEEARRHPNRNLITRALGPDENATCDGFLCPLAPGDFLLLCTDGLIDTVTDEEMRLEIGAPLETCLNRLLDIAKSRGAADNVTAVLMQNG
ncbi:MAG: Stp1/IreP family PP2C-type Ser/Thr phosphatase [Oscillospiraceae bacterium]